MQFKISERDGAAVVSMEGQLNFASNEQFEGLLDRLIKSKPSQVVFDLSELSQIDSVGLGLLYIAQEDLGGQGCGLTLSGAKEAVQRLLELTEAHKTFTIVP